MDHDPMLGATPLVRSYVITNGQDLAEGDLFDMTTLVTAQDVDHARPILDPERLRVLELCSGGYLSVAEIAAHTALPVGVVRVLLASLAREGRVLRREPVPRAVQPDLELIEEVLSGLIKRFA